MGAMEDLYSPQPSAPGTLLGPRLVEGLHCAAKLDNDSNWYRVLISRVWDNTVEVFLLDFGTMATVPFTPRRVRRLLPQFSQLALAAQAVRARLEVAPIHGETWPLASSKRLQELMVLACDNKVKGRGENGGLVARLEGWGQDRVPVVRLLDTVTNSLEDGLDLGRRLVDEGLARFVVEVEGQSEQPLVRRLELSSCLLHLVSWKSDTWVTSAEVSLLQGSWKGYNLLEWVLGRRAGASFHMERLVEAEDEEVWEGLVEAGVGGLVDRNGQ